MTAVDDRPAAPASGWDEEFWDVLLALIAKDRVIPVIGRALSLVTIEGRSVSVDRYVATRLADKLGIDTTPLGDSFGLDAVVRAHMRRRGPLDELYPRVNAILREELEPPDALVKLARIPSFRLFVTTAFDPLLERAIAAAGGDSACESIGYVPSDPRGCDLRLSTSPTRTVYHILGKASPLPEFVISDDDLLEYVVALHDSERRPARLFDQLRSHDLLILGGNLSDWLFRQFLRLAKHQRLSERPMREREFVADDSASGDPALVSFLSSFSPQTKVFAGGPQAFIDELWRRWSDSFGSVRAASALSGPEPAASPQAQAPQDGDIFVSYAREDLDAAEALVAGLRVRGFRVWFDQHKIGAGDEFEYVIRQAIASCTVFIPIISANTERDLRDAFFRLEWNAAIKRDERNHPSVRFIMPVIIDGTPFTALEGVPSEFKKKDIRYVDKGVPTPALIEALAGELKGAG